MNASPFPLENIKRGVLRLAVSVLAGLLLAPAGVAQQADVQWTQELRFEKLPDELAPQWRGLGEGRTYIEESHLVIDTSDNSSGANYVWRVEGDVHNRYWDASRPTTVEFRCRVRELQPGKTSAAHIVIADSRKYYSFPVGSDEWMTYRVVINDGIAELYRNNNETPEHTSSGYSLPEGVNSNHFYFGDAGDEIGGITEWIFLRWTNEGSFPPPPHAQQ